jgi:hypothetical protein
MTIKNLKKIIKDIPDHYNIEFVLKFLFKGEEDKIEFIFDSKKLDKSLN